MNPTKLSRVREREEFTQAADLSAALNIIDSVKIESQSDKIINELGKISETLGVNLSDDLMDRFKLMPTMQKLNEKYD